MLVDSLKRDNASPGARKPTATKPEDTISLAYPPSEVEAFLFGDQSPMSLKGLADLSNRFSAGLQRTIEICSERIPAYAFNKPLSAAGLSGDFCLLLPFGKDRVVALMGDIMGKGHEACAFSLMLQSRLHEHRFVSACEAIQGTSPKNCSEALIQALILANRIFDETCEEFTRRHHAEDGRVFLLPLVIAAIDAPSRRVTLASAGFPVALLISPDGESRQAGGETRLIISGLPLTEGEIEVSTHELTSGTRVFLATDGIGEMQVRPQFLAPGIPDYSVQSQLRANPALFRLHEGTLVEAVRRTLEFCEEDCRDDCLLLGIQVP